MLSFFSSPLVWLARAQAETLRMRLACSLHMLPSVFLFYPVAEINRLITFFSLLYTRTDPINGAAHAKVSLGMQLCLPPRTMPYAMGISFNSIGISSNLRSNQSGFALTRSCATWQN